MGLPDESGEIARRTAIATAIVVASPGERGGRPAREVTTDARTGERGRVALSVRGKTR